MLSRVWSRCHVLHLAPHIFFSAPSEAASNDNIMKWFGAQNKPQDGPTVRIEPDPYACGSPPWMHDDGVDESWADEAPDYMSMRRRGPRPPLPPSLQNANRHIPIPYEARYFVIKSNTELDVVQSLCNGIWASTQHGNLRLGGAWETHGRRGGVYLFFSVNRTGHFCGVARMTTQVDATRKFGCWEEDGRWGGAFEVEWLFVKDVPSMVLKNFTMSNGALVTRSRDAREIPPSQGGHLIKFFRDFNPQTSMLERL